MGLFRGQLHARPIIHQKKRTTQWTKSAYEMKSSWVVQPKFRSFGGLCTAYRCGIRWSKIDMLQAYKNGAGAATTVWE